MTSQASDPCVVRRVPVGSIDRTCARVPAARIETGWQVLIEDRWFHVEAEPELIGDGLDDDGGRVRLVLTGPGAAVFRRGERLWVRAPQPDTIPTLGCADPDCPADGPYTLTDDGLLCGGHLAAYALADTAGPGDEGELEVVGRG